MFCRQICPRPPGPAGPFFFSLRGSCPFFRTPPAVSWVQQEAVLKDGPPFFPGGGNDMLIRLFIVIFSFLYHVLVKDNKW